MATSVLVVRSVPPIECTRNAATEYRRNPGTILVASVLVAVGIYMTTIISSTHVIINDEYSDSLRFHNKHSQSATPLKHSLLCFSSMNAQQCSTEYEWWR